MYFYNCLDANGNPISLIINSVTDSNGNPATGRY